MRRNRLSRWLMLVAVLSINLAVARGAFQGGGHESILTGELTALFGPMAIVVQFGLWRALEARGECRPFWAGFTAGGLLVIGWTALGFLTMSQVFLAPINAYEAFPKALLYDILLGGSMASKRYLLARPGLRLAYSSASLFALQVAVALAIGLSLRFIVRRSSRPPERRWGARSSGPESSSSVTAGTSTR
jgi:hypothetical protein